MKLFQSIGVLGNKLSVFLRYTGGKIGLRTRGYVVLGNRLRHQSVSDTLKIDELVDGEISSLFLVLVG